MTAGLSLYTTGAGIIIAMSFLTVCVAVLGCCGAHKQSRQEKTKQKVFNTDKILSFIRVMLTSFSVILLLQFIIMLAGAIVANNGGVSQDIQDDMIQTLGYYNDNATETSDSKAFAVKEVWNKFQAEFHCCGVINVTDWSTGQPNNKKYNFPAGENKPQGCCTLKRDGTEIAADSADETACRKAAATAEDATYYFGGCFTGMMERVNSHKSSMITIGVLTLVFMFVNIVSSFGLCMMLTGDV